MRVLSGIQPSGTLHIGNYLGMMRQMIELQAQNELFCFLADLHAMTSLNRGADLRAKTLQAALDFLALGIDPDKAVFWVQSTVPEINELAWYLSNITPVGLLERCHSYKDKLAKGLPANAGLFNYPLLMAADILAVQSDIVPVGQDQKQHLEVTRDIAIKFNNEFGETFQVPDALIKEGVAIVPGTDGQKMSKSYGNTIEIFGEEKVLRKQVMNIVTDSTPLEQPKNPATCNVFKIYALLATAEQKLALAQKYRAGGYGYGEAKKETFALLWEYFRPYRERRAELSQNLDAVQKILQKGTDKARAEIAKTLQAVREKTGAFL
ncbi:tryptophanyl-tRNA synthetase [Candidatus Termititenax persephonae]|uniref:Tryptophan--tRNA ligase n=1 Tax=Candidatus Termititenax persephonae TaxID=2218525 RepID=A0A388TF37_9BACT|nr:tryptophanyl-tRNA synthetase [Candidatus Termititenax persephonae]